MRRKIPHLLIEQLRLGELPAKRREELLGEPETAERLRLLGESDTEILARYPAGQMAERIRERAKAEGVAKRRPLDLPPRVIPRIAFGLRRAWGGPRLLPLLAAAILVVGVALVPILLSTGERNAGGSGEGSVRVKGILPALRIYRETPKGIELLADGSSVRRGDLLQIGYIAGAARYGTIFSVDGSGTITLHYPEREDAMPLLKTGGEVLLPFSYELDAAPRFERFLFVTSGSPFSVREILQIMRRTEARQGATALPSLPHAFGLVTLTLNKGGL